MKTDFLLTPPPDNVDAVFCDRFFMENLQAEIAKIKNPDETQLPDGCKFKRTPYDSLNEMGILSAIGVIREYWKIRQRETSLSSNKRKAVEWLLYMATRKMYMCYNHINCMVPCK